MLNDLNHFWGGDLSTGPTGDIATVSGTQRGEQRVLRRLMSNPAVTNPDGSITPGDYVFHPDYGAGLRRFIGQPLAIDQIVAVIRSQLLLEDSVAVTPAPVISVRSLAADNSSFSVRIAYNDSATNTPTVLAFNVTS